MQASSRRRVSDRREWWGIVVAAILALVPSAAAAQTSVTTSVSQRRQLDLSFDFLQSVTSRDAGGFAWYFPAATFGLGGGVEIGSAFSATLARDGAEREWMPSAKWRWLETERGTSAAIGAAWHVPAPRGDGPGPYGFLYMAIAHSVGDAHEATITAGAYAIAGTRSDVGTRRGLTLGWDQTISGRWSLSVDWISGDNWYGYLSPAVTFASATRWVTAGYCVGNAPAANHGPCLSVGRTF